MVSVINKQASSSDDNDILSMFGADSDSSSSSSGSLQTASEGSGVIYKKSGNAAYIVTNNHVVSGASALQVIMSNGKKVQAELVGTDSTTDLAVLKISQLVCSRKKRYSGCCIGSAVVYRVIFSPSV